MPNAFNQPCGALKEDERKIWRGNLHFPVSGDVGYIAAYLLPNPRGGIGTEPQLFIMHAASITTIGALWRLPNGEYKGQLNTAPAIVLKAFFSDTARDGVQRLVIRHVSGVRPRPRYPVTLDLIMTEESFKHHPLE